MMPTLDHLADITGEADRRLERIFEAFEVAWRERARPRIADYLPDDDPRLRRPALVELVYIDQEYAIRSDSPARLEDYLAEFPELATDPDVLSELIARDFRHRWRRGDVPSTEEYVDRFPHLGDRLEARLKAEAGDSSRHSGASTVEAVDPSSRVDAIPSALPTDDGPLYDSLRFHARGGLGDVYRARDIELSREVAIKRIRLEHSSKSRVRRRFLREARLTARLNHPGVVPIHGLIWDGHDQPWYVMRFVEGKTLDLAIKEYHGLLADETHRDDRALAFRNLLARFVVVCDTIGFAHSLDVIHRDLKPSNVILGDYGETIVLDWGLATSSTTGGDDRAPTRADLPPVLDLDPLTQLGQVLGTPGFMSPEQAEGLPSMNRPASDIYALGAILQAILTGSPPSRTEGPPRSSKADVPAALEAIRREAMSPNPADRYETAGALARDIERWAADEPVSAHAEPWARRARRWAKKHRTGLSTAATAATVAAVLLGGLAAWRVAERRKTDASALATLGRASTLAIEAKASGDLARWDSAIAETLRARERLESGAGSPSIHREVVDRLESFGAERDRLRIILDAGTKDRRVVADLEEARLRGAEVRDGNYDTSAKNDAILAAFRAYGIDVASLPVAESVARVRSSKVVAELIAALDDWEAHRPTNVPPSRLAAILRAAETDPERAAIRDAAIRGDAAALRLLCDREEDRVKLGPRLRSVFEALLRLDPAGSFSLLEAIRRERPSDFWVNHDLGMAYRAARPPRLQEAMLCLSVAVGLRPDSPGVRSNFGMVLKDRGDADAAVAQFHVALKLDPEFAEAHDNLGNTLMDKGDVNAAIAEFRAALRIKPGHAAAHSNLGNALLTQGDRGAAIAEFRAAIGFDPGLALAHSNLGGALLADRKPEESIAECRVAIGLDPRSAMAHNNLGNALLAQGDVAGAVEACRIAIALDPEFAKAHNSLGNALSNQGKWDDSITEYRAAIRINPENAGAHSNLGNALLTKGDVGEAIAEYRAAIRIKPGLAQAHNNLGSALLARGDVPGAVDAFRAALGLDPGLAEAHNNLGNALLAKGDVDAAITEYRSAIRRPDYAQARYNLANALSQKGDLDGACSIYEATLRIRPDYAEARYNFGNALRSQGKLDAAIEQYREAIRIKPELADARRNLAITLEEKGDLDGSAAEYRAALRIWPEDAVTHCELGLLLKEQGHFADALVHFQRGHELGSKRPGWRYDSENWVAECRRLIEVEGKYRAIVEGTVKPVDAKEQLTVADYCLNRKRYADSARAFDGAFAENPALAEDLRAGSRYNAACAAALAGSGQGKDEPMPDANLRAKLREKARVWLRADLAGWAKIIEGGGDASLKPSIAGTLAHWKQDPDLAGIRDDEALTKWPDAEREALRSFWAEVESLRKKAPAGR